MKEEEQNSIGHDPSRQSGPKTAVLLVNTGTPDAPEKKALHHYLREFLSDPRVMDAPFLIRKMVLHLFILPFRPARSAEKYRKIWTEEGSPLLVHTRELARSLQQRYNQAGQSVPVDYAMRYGNPSLGARMSELRNIGVKQIILVPLFPQYAEATVGSIVEEAGRQAARHDIDLEIVPPFFHHQSYLDVLAMSLRQQLDRQAFEADHFVFTYHGLPERQIKKHDPVGVCLKNEECCHVFTKDNAHCYRAQCFETSRNIARRLGIEPENYSVSFQSRMGRIPWIGPHTDEVLAELGQATTVSNEHLRVAVCAPSFVADCLETLEEIALVGQEIFLGAGGHGFTYLTALNGGPLWADALFRIIQDFYSPEADTDR